MLQYLVFLGAALNLSGVAVYIKGTLKGTTKPNRVTYLLWSIAPMIGSAAALASGVRWAVLPVFMTGFGPFLVLMASFMNKNSYWKLGIYDYICGVFSLLALVLWGITNDPVIAIVFAIISDAFAGLPTLIKSWTNPETESGSGDARHYHDFRGGKDVGVFGIRFCVLHYHHRWPARPFCVPA